MMIMVRVRTTTTTTMMMIMMTIIMMTMMVIMMMMMMMIVMMMVMMLWWSSSSTISKTHAQVAMVQSCANCKRHVGLLSSIICCVSPGAKEQLSLVSNT